MPYKDPEKRKAVAHMSYLKGKGKREQLAWERLTEMLHYNPKNGKWHWLKRSGRSKAGTEAGTNRPDGYVQIRLDNCTYLAHRLAYFYVTKKWPSEHIDHKRGNGADNRWKELRSANRYQNLGNAKRHCDNQSGYKGVCKKRKFWVAEIMFQRQKYFLGNFHSVKQAHAAYCKAAKMFRGEFARFK